MDKPISGQLPGSYDAEILALSLDSEILNSINVIIAI